MNPDCNWQHSKGRSVVESTDKVKEGKSIGKMRRFDYQVRMQQINKDIK
jgi:hypothetical protein